MKNNREKIFKQTNMIESLNRKIHSMQEELKMKDEVIRETARKYEEWNRDISECSSEI